MPAVSHLQERHHGTPEEQLEAKTRAGVSPLADLLSDSGSQFTHFRMLGDIPAYILIKQAPNDCVYKLAWKRWLGSSFQTSTEQVFILEPKLHVVSLHEKCSELRENLAGTTQTDRQTDGRKRGTKD